MSKYIKQSQKKVSGALGIFNKAIAQLTKANSILEKGAESQRKKYDFTCGVIKSLEYTLDEVSVSITSHQTELKNNNKLIEKFKEFAK